MLSSFKIKSLRFVGALIFWANLSVLAYLLRKGKFSRRLQPRCCAPAAGPPGRPGGLWEEAAIGLVVRGQSEHGEVTPGQRARGRRHSLAAPKPSVAAAPTLTFHLVKGPLW